MTFTIEVGIGLDCDGTVQCNRTPIVGGRGTVLAAWHLKRDRSLMSGPTAPDRTFEFYRCDLMLTHRRKPVSLSLISTDLPVWSVVETAGTLYQKDRDRFHLLLSEPAIRDLEFSPGAPEVATLPTAAKSRLLWLEISPYRVIMTMQGNGNFSYRHLWERCMYGVSRYWLQNDGREGHGQLRMRNYTRRLRLIGRPVPEHLRLEYELWSQNLQLGRYILNLEIHH